MALIAWADSFNHGTANLAGTETTGRPYAEEANGYTIASDRAAPGGGSFDQLLMWVHSGDVDIECQVGSGTLPGGNNHGLHLRGSSATVFHRIVWSSSGSPNLFFQEHIPGITTLGSATVSTTGPRTLRVTLIRNVWNIYFDGALVIGPITDATRPSDRVNKCGMGANATTAPQDRLVIRVNDGRRLHRQRARAHHHRAVRGH